MIKKIYRLSERQVKKVLSKRKPFFSYDMVLNYFPNNLDFNRYAIVISGKSVQNNVNRVFFRRKFYDMSKKLIDTQEKKGFDMVFVLKKQIKLDKKDINSIKSFEKDIQFLLKKVIINSNTKK